MAIVYTTETPTIDTHGYHFNYYNKRSAYVDCCYAVLGLNKSAKTAPDNLRWHLYRLKVRWLEHLYRNGFCVQATQEERLVWQLVFLVDTIRFQWHLPYPAITWPIKEKRSAVFYEWQDYLPMRRRPLEEAVALIEWVLAR